MDSPAPRRRFDLVAYLKLVRFPLVFTAIADSAAGCLLVNGAVVRNPWIMGCLALASGGLYLFGMAWNDIADREKDAREAPGKVIPSGRVSLNGARAVAISLLLASLVGVLLCSDWMLWQRLVTWACIVVMILAYDLHWVKAPPIMGLVRACNLLLGQVVAISFLDPALKVPAVDEMSVVTVAPLFVYVTSLTYVSTLEDAALDRRKLVLGVAGMSIGALLAATAIPLSVVIALKGDVSVSLLRSLGVAWVLVAWLWFRAWKSKDRKGVMLLVRDGVAGIILVDAALVLSMADGIYGAAIASLILPAAISLYLFKKLA